MWPFWDRLIADFPGLRVVLLMLLRPPHEIAMSLTVRSKGQCSFSDALDLTAIHLRQMGEIWESWQGDRARVRFVEPVLAEDLRQAAERCGLAWRQEALAAFMTRLASTSNPWSWNTRHSACSTDSPGWRPPIGQRAVRGDGSETR